MMELEYSEKGKAVYNKFFQIQQSIFQKRPKLVCKILRFPKLDFSSSIHLFAIKY